MVAAFNKIPFAIREADRKIVSIEDVPRGLACECRCPSCDARLQARKGDFNEHHFAHHDSSAELCEFALETSIRLMLLETLGKIQSISTPDFLWVKEIIIRGRENVALTFDLDLSQGNQSPHFIYRTPQNDDYRVGLYLPAAGQNLPPLWLDEFTTAKPKIGLLQLNYRAIAEQLRGGHNNEYVAKLINIVQTEPKALSWLYHPRYQERVKQRQQQEEEERQQEHNERQARLQQYRILQAQQAEQALQAKTRLQLAYHDLEHRPYGSNQEWAPLSGERVSQGNCVRRCRICKAPLEQSSPSWFCNKRACIAARHRKKFRF